MSLAPFIRAMGRGPSRGRNLTREESAEAMRLILSGAAAPEGVGALLMLMRYRGETAAEIAGFVDSIRPTVTAWAGLGGALDWPSYAAGRSRGLPWFLLSARLVGRAGIPVFLHGWNSHQGAVADVRQALPGVGISVSHAPEEARRRLQEQGVTYVPLEAMSTGLLELLKLREILGLRSAINTTLRVLNPSRAAISVQGVFHPPYRTLQQDVGSLLEQPSLAVLKGGGGEFERHPGKPIEVLGSRRGVPFDVSAAPLVEVTRRLADEEPKEEHLPALWAGDHRDPFAEAIVTGTAAIALFAAERAKTLEQADALALQLWNERHSAAAA